MKKSYFGYIIPSMFSFLLSGIYSIVDGLFVGNALGDYGLAGINIAWPMVAAIISLGTGLGMGGAVVASLRKGAGDESLARKSEGNTIALLAAGGVFITILFLLTKDTLLTLLGAGTETFSYASEYMSYILIGGAIQVLASGMVPLIRNRGRSLTAMLLMGGGFLTNIVLDWLFVFKFGMGMKGAAIATVLGQSVTLIPCLIFFFTGKQALHLKELLPSWPLCSRIIRVALSPFGLTFLPSVTIILINLMSARYGGPTAVSAYAVLSYVSSITLLTIQGVTDGSQPLISLSKGGGRIRELFRYRNQTLMLAAATGLLGCLLSWGFKDAIPLLFGSSPKAGAMISEVMPLFAASFILSGVTKTCVSYFYATDRIVKSSFLVYGEAALTTILCLTLPLFLGQYGVWLTIPLTQVLLCFPALYFLIRDSSREKINLPKMKSVSES